MENAAILVQRQVRRKQATTKVKGKRRARTRHGVWSKLRRKVRERSGSREISPTARKRHSALLADHSLDGRLEWPRVRKPGASACLAPSPAGGQASTLTAAAVAGPEGTEATGGAGLSERLLESEAKHERALLAVEGAWEQKAQRWETQHEQALLAANTEWGRRLEASQAALASHEEAARASQGAHSAALSAQQREHAAALEEALGAALLQQKRAAGVKGRAATLACASEDALTGKAAERHGAVLRRQQETIASLEARAPAPAPFCTRCMRSA